MAMTSIARQKISTLFSTNRYKSCDLLRSPLPPTIPVFSKGSTLAKSVENDAIKMVSDSICTFGVNCLHVRCIPFALGNNPNSLWPMAYRWAGSARTYIFRSPHRHQPKSRRRKSPPYSPGYSRYLLSRPLWKLTHGLKKTGGRTRSNGHITSFHRGGGAKQKYRRIDFKREHPAVGVVERVEYDPCRSSRISLVRWMEGIPLPNLPKEEHPRNATMFTVPSSTPVKSQFSLSTVPGKVYPPFREGHNNFQIKSMSALIGLPPSMRRGKSHIVTEYGTYKHENVRDCFLNTFNSPKPRKSRWRHFRDPGNVFRYPRVAAVGAKPAFYAARKLGEDGRPENPEEPLMVRAWKDRFTVCKKKRDTLSWNYSRSRVTKMRV